MRILHVGDVHAVESELADCSALTDYILKVALEKEVDYVLFEGDQYHNHSLVHLEVMRFWKSTFKMLRDNGLKVLALVGNHDMTGREGSSANAMMAHTEHVKVIEKPTVVDNVLLLPYFSDHAAFVQACVDHSDWCPTVVCHQTFQGSTYENGFYASDGIEPNLVPQENIISGHIHTPQTFGKVFYTGAPRWRTLSDANVERAIWVIEYSGGSVVSTTPYSTGEVCRQIRHLVDTPESPIPSSLDPKHQYRVDIRGPAEYVEARKKELAGPGIRIRTFPTQTSSLNQVRESEGVEKAFAGYLAKFEGKFGTPRETLESLAKERLGV